MTKSPWIEPIYEVDPYNDESFWEPWIDGFSGQSCSHVFTSVSDTGAVVTPTNGKFNVTLTAK